MYGVFGYAHNPLIVKANSAPRSFTIFWVANTSGPMTP